MKIFSYKKVKPKYKRSRKHNRYYIVILGGLKIKIMFKYVSFILFNKLLIEYNGWRE